MEKTLQDFIIEQRIPQKYRIKLLVKPTIEKLSFGIDLQGGFEILYEVDTGIALIDLMKLNPEGKVDRHTALVGNNLNMLILNLLGNAQCHLEALDLERAAILGSLPLLDLVFQCGREQVEARDYREDKRCGVMYLLLF